MRRHERNGPWSVQTLQTNSFCSLFWRGYLYPKKGSCEECRGAFAGVLVRIELKLAPRFVEGD